MPAVLALVGRKTELERFEQFLDGVLAGPRGLVVEGELGIGKTELLSAGIDSARARGFEVRAARAAQAEAKLSLSVLVDLLEPLSERTIEDLAAPRREALLAALLRQTPSKPFDQRMLGVAVLDVLRHLSQERPLLLAIDDEHWLDGSTASVLAFALRRLVDEPVGFVSTRRLTAEEPPRKLGMPLADAPRLTLGPLDIHALERLIEDRACVYLPLPTLQRVHDLSGGNPLFALEIVRGLPPGDPRIQASEPFPVAEDLAVLLGRRIERLPTATRDALAVAAMADRPSVELVVSITRDTTVLEPALGANILQLTDGTIRFTHPLLAVVAASAASECRRREIHRELSDQPTDPESRARHLALAAEAPDEHVAATLEDAARTARARGALPDAGDIWELAVRMTPPEQVRDVARRRIETAAVQLLAGDDVAGLAHIDSVLAAVPSGPLRAEAIRVAARRTFEDVERTIELLDDALGQADLDTELLVDLHGHYAWTLWRGADPEAGQRHATTALGLAEGTGDARLICDSLTALGALSWGLGCGPPYRHLERALGLAANVPDGWPYVGDRPELVVADVIGHDARFEEAARMFSELLDDARRHGDEPSVASVLWNLGTMETLSGDWWAAREHLTEAVRLRRQEGMRPMESLASLAFLRACEGHVEEARVEAGEAIATSMEWRDVTGGLFCYQAAGLIELTAGSPEAACAPLVTAAGQLRASALRSPDLCLIVADEIDALLGAGRIEEAEPEVSWLEEWTEWRGGWTVALARRSRGHLQGLRRQLDEARDTLGEAVAGLDRARIPFECARALLLLGAVERRRRQKRRAREAFARAAKTFRSLGAPMWAERASAELDRVGGRPPAPRGLTETEREVAQLVASGRRNREVAEALFMSPKTVEAHLTHIYSKLGIHSRTELAAALTRGRTADQSQGFPRFP